MRRSLLFLAALFACSDTTTAPGELVLAIQTDVALPDSVDRIRIEVSSLGTLQLGNEYQVGPNALRIPATLGVLQGKDPATPVTIRLIAKQGSKVKMLREMVTTVPSKRVATLRIPIRWLCDDSAKQAPNGDVSDGKCPAGQTCIAGDCHPSTVDSGAASDFDTGDVFGGGTGNGDGACFDVVKCMVEGNDVPVDTASCTIAKPADTTNLNVALRVDNDGICDPSRSVCFVVLDSAPLDGWQDIGSRIQLPREVCNRIASGRVKSVVVSNTCPTKTEKDNVCGTWSSVGSPSTVTISDAGTDGGPLVDGGPMGTLASFPGDIVDTRQGLAGCTMHVVNGHLLFCTTNMLNGTLHALRLSDGMEFDYAELPTGARLTGPWLGNDKFYWSATSPSFTSVDYYTAPIDADAADAGGGGPFGTSAALGFDQEGDLSRAIDASRFYATVNGTVLALDRGNATSATLGTLLVRYDPGVVLADSDDTTGFVYVGGNAGVSRIERMAKNGSGPSLVTTVSTPSLESMVLDGTDLWFLSQTTDAADHVTGGAIYRVPAAGGTAVAVYSGLKRPAQLALDPTSVYWIDSSTGLEGDLVMRAPKAGGPKDIVVSEPSSSIGTMAVDDKIYYAVSPNGTARADLKSAPK